MRTSFSLFYAMANLNRLKVVLADKYRSWADALQFTHPFVSSTLLLSLVKTYEFEAEQNDTEACVERRLRY